MSENQIQALLNFIPANWMRPIHVMQVVEAIHALISGFDIDTLSMGIGRSLLTGKNQESVWRKYCLDLRFATARSVIQTDGP